MNIGINLLGEQKLKSGTGRYSYEILKQLSLRPSTEKNRYIVFAPKGISQSFNIISPNIKIVELSIPTHVIFRRIFEQLLLPFHFIKHRLDWIHSTNNLGVLFCFRKNSVTVHDLARFRVPNNSSPIMNVFMKVLQFCTLKTAGRIVAVSEATKTDLIQILHISENRIVVAKNAIDTNKFRKIPLEDIKSSLSKMGIDYEYIFMYSSLERRKNYIGAIKALKLSGLPIKLLLVGKKSYRSEEIFETIKELNMRNQVEHLGFVSDEQLVALINGCKFFVFPTFFEGAGLTPLEAIACHKAVLASDLPCIREYCGNAFYPVDPENTESIAEGMKLLYTDSNLREDLIKRGDSIRNKYSWKDHAEKLLSIWK